MVEGEIDKLLPPAMARSLKWMLKKHADMNMGSLVDMLEFVEGNPQVARATDLWVQSSHGLLTLRWQQMSITFYGGRGYNVCGCYIGRHLEVSDYTQGGRV